MAAHNDLGKIGENLAVDFLIENGFTILERNWRNRFEEIDIIAINNLDLYESEFLVKVLRHGATWLTTGKHESLQQTIKITQSVEERQSIIAPAWKRSPTAWAISTKITLETAGGR